MELVLNGVPGLSVIRSKSVSDLWSIQVVPLTEADLLPVALQLVAERVSRFHRRCQPGLPRR